MKQVSYMQHDCGKSVASFSKVLLILECIY